jgi:hypothetical protein
MWIPKWILNPRGSGSGAAGGIDGSIADDIF